MTYRVLIPQDIKQEGKDYLTARGYEIRMGHGAEVGDIIRDVADCDAILARTAPLPREVIEAGTRLRVIARHGVGVDNIDVGRAEELGIWVTNAPESNSNTVAEHAMLLMLGLARKIVPVLREFRAGNFAIRNPERRIAGDAGILTEVCRSLERRLLCGMARSLPPVRALLFVVLVSARLYGDVSPPISLAGTWTTEHPRSDLGTVHVQFAPAAEPIEYRGESYPAYTVSVWKNDVDSARKVREGLFGPYTTAAVVNGTQGPLLLWRADGNAGHESDAFNAIIRVDGRRTIHIGGADPSTPHGDLSTVLRRSDIDRFPERAHDSIDLPGVYRFRHPETGDVHVRFAAIDASIAIDGRSTPAYTVSTVARVGELGYSAVRPGLFGGSYSNDTYLLVALDFTDDGTWLVWQNPAATRVRRRTRIVTVYDNGDIGVADDDDRYRERSVFRRVDGADAIVAPYSELLPIEGRFRVSIGDLVREVEITRSGVDLQGEHGIGSLLSISTVDEADGSIVHGGIYPGDPFGHVAVVNEDGAGFLVWYSFAYDRAERLRIVEPSSTGFATDGGHDGERFLVARFDRLNQDSPQPAEDEPTALPMVQPKPAVVERARHAATELLRAVVPESLEGMPRARRGAVSPAIPHLPDGIGGLEGILTTRIAREMLERLAVDHYRSLPSATRSEWQRFAIWSSGTTPTARNVSSAGYAAEHGMLSPELDFATTVVEYFFPTPYRDPMNRLRHRLPGRFRFVESLYGPGGEQWQSPLVPLGVSDWINPDDVEWVELVITTPTATAPESLAGHLLLLIKRYGDYEDARDSIVLGFVGVTTLDTANRVDQVTYAWRGMTGHYRTTVAQETLDRVALRATLTEARDVRRLRLLLSTDEINRLIERLWEVRRSFEYEYRFFDVNCASMLMDTLNHALDPDRRVPVRIPAVAPLYVAAHLDRHGLIEGPVFPEHWSIDRNARVAETENAELRRRLIGSLDARVNDGRMASPIRNEAGSLLDLLHSEIDVPIGTDQLFREPIIGTGSAARSWAYGRLGAILAEALDDDRDFSELVLRYLSNAFDIELARASRAGQGRSTAGAAGRRAMMVDVREEYVRARLLEVQRRERDSLEVRGVRLAQSTVRLALSDSDAGPWIYSIGEDARTRRAKTISDEHDRSGGNHGYFPVLLTSKLSLSTGLTRASLGVEVALFDEPLGNTSRYALRRSMRLSLLSVGIGAELAIRNGQVDWGVGHNSIDVTGRVAEYRIVLTGIRGPYTGFMNHGFGFTVMDGRLSLRDSPQAWELNATARVAEAIYILNVFESGDFRHYATLSAGSAWIVDWRPSSQAHRVEIPITAQLKLQIRPSTSVRAEARWIPALDTGGSIATGAYGSVEIERSWSNVRARAEVSAAR